MKQFLLLTLLSMSLGTIVLAEDIDVSSEKDPSKRIQMIPLDSILVPNKTPFDADPEARKIYVEEYRLAYRTVLAEVDVGCYMSISGPFQIPMERGHRDGLADAKRKYPEKAARVLGLTLEEYRKIEHLFQSQSIP